MNTKVWEWTVIGSIELLFGIYMLSIGVRL